MKIKSALTSCISSFIEYYRNTTLKSLHSHTSVNKYIVVTQKLDDLYSS